MSRFICTMNDGSYINIDADRMIMQNETMVCAYSDQRLVAMVDISAVISAHLSEKTEANAK